jgi:predicted acyltransferase
MAQIMKPFVVSSLRIHLPLVGMVLRYLKNLPLNASWRPTELPDVTFDGPNASLLQGLLTLLVLWLICFWMYRHRIFIKI